MCDWECGGGLQDLGLLRANVGGGCPELREILIFSHICAYLGMIQKP